MKNLLENTETQKKFDGLGNDMFSVIPGISNAKDAPIVDASSLDQESFYKNWVLPNKACLIKGAIKHWPAINKFKEPEYWLSVCEDFDITVYPHMNYNMGERQSQDSEDISFHGAIKRLFSNEDYILSIPSEKVEEGNNFSELIKDTPGFSFLSGLMKPRMYDQRRFFMYRRAATAWHYHNIDETLMCQINGGKKVAILPPDIPDPKYVNDFLMNEHYLEGKKLKENLDLKPMIAHVEEGDALYIPPYWYHAVVPMDGEVGFTYAYCWKSPLFKFGEFSNYFVRRLYKDGFWPLKNTSLIMPFLGFYTGFLYTIIKIKRLFVRAA
ncbi:Cupin-like domain-containing protein [Chryseobacterium taeanense]|uniref:Cupin-like domain-containing protein n=1 Tax=Chryseobacterium taeanense TaxID=311334 RepID=A0A1G8PH05_9FLAO|nr:cupin-like domain-containing protein [Chryseobacterium taeanense]SDI91588.1 Cupin-like domain-containing protein [Chryseobacterium taeanense]